MDGTRSPGAADNSDSIASQSRHFYDDCHPIAHSTYCTVVVRVNNMPEGVQPASGILAHVVRTIFGDLSSICIVAQDNFLIRGVTLVELLENFKTVMRCCLDYNVILSAAKTRIGLVEIPSFGYILGN